MNDRFGRSDGPLRRRREPILRRHRKIPVRALVPNAFTLLSLCAGLTAVRMAIEHRFEFALVLIVVAAAIDGIDGRLARALKVQSRFGAELDSLADTVNFGVAPAMLIYLWGLQGLKGFGWVAVVVFACCMGLRLARFNAALEVDTPKWQSNYFTGIPAPAGALTAMLPFYLESAGIVTATQHPAFIATYVLGVAFMLVSTIPTWSGKLLGERVSRELALPILGGLALVLALLWTYPYATASVMVTTYLALIPLSHRQYRLRLAADAGGETVPAAPDTEKRPATDPSAPSETKH
jgi:CDP-diacylglycerol--serine O-phosphatidyltransferase